VRRKTHAGFGERPGETDRQQYRHRAPGRLNHPELRIPTLRPRNSSKFRTAR
jgi:hypothetical protein